VGWLAVKLLKPKVVTNTIKVFSARLLAKPVILQPELVIELVAL